ncbi:cation-transporting P-type ATPase [Candidatus Falkowbacteria bacterium]|nr:cation-transporting P-type ATPase [Candidatus Falkowbacteria bacterium]
MTNQIGLTSNEAKSKLAEFGPNQIYKPTGVNFWTIARQEVTEPMILLLLVVGFFYSLWGKLEDAITIFVVIFLLVLAEVWNEFRAKRAIAALEKLAAPKTKVFRDGAITEINSEEVVPGDILILTVGTKIAADAKIKKSLGLALDESALTGESFPKEKKLDEEIFAGTTVVAGVAEAEVTKTGKMTRLGELAAAAKIIKPPKTALQLAMKSLSKKMVYVAVFFSVLIPTIGILRGEDLRTMILTGLSLSFATIPEELPIIITMILGLGAYTLSKNNFLVKKIKVAETLGNATVIVTDKTGTITENKLKIAAAIPAGKEKNILETALAAMSEFSLFPLDQAIEDNAKELGISTPGKLFHQRDLGDGRKTKSAVRKTGDGFELFASGAPEEILAMCRADSAGIAAELLRQTGLGRRVIAVAKKTLAPGEENFDFIKLEKEMNFVGLLSFEDPPRAGVRETILQAARAGVRTIMVTGDHPLTAIFIAKSVGITGNGKVLTGAELDKLNDAGLQETVKTVFVFARTTPEHKYRLVQALQKNGEVVAVTGDGINDALALRGADIGIAMGKRGTDVAKEAAEVVLADDNYVTIAQGIFEGRKFFDNLSKGIKYYLSVKVALVLIFLLPVILGIPTPMSPIQIIILELFMDLAASAGFISEPKEKNIYARPPRDPKEKVFNARALRDIILKGLTLFASVTIVYFYARSKNFELHEAQTFAFTAWIFGHIILAFVSRSDREPLFSLGFFTNKIINFWAVAAIAFLFFAIFLSPLGARFNLAPINLSQIFLIALVPLVIILPLEIRKLFYSR